MEFKYNDPVVVSVSGDKRHKRRRSRLLPLILSILFAFALWFYVMSVESPIYEKTFNFVPVTVIQNNSEGALSVYSGGEASVVLTVSGRRSTLNRLTVEDFDITADVSGYTTAGRYNVPLNFVMPDGATKVSSNIDSVSIYLDNRTTVSVPVTVKFTEYTLDEGYEIAEASLEKSAESVIVTGPKSALDAIVEARMTAELGHITGSKKISGTIELVDESGKVVSNPYISTDITDITVRVPVLVSRELPLKVEYKHGFFNLENSKITLSPSNVTVKGEVELVNEYNEIILTTVDEKLVPIGKSTVAFTPPEGLTVIDGTESVDISLTLKGLVTKTVAVSDINIKNPEGYTYKPERATCNVTLRGTPEAIEAITERDVALNVDISGMTTGQQSVSAAADVVISEAYQGLVIEIGSYTITLER
ncbi:MAG: hypothetical protein IJD17_02545 [Clostridia bacterium]|nr:hypothetical protein [Clostridia bacterium]